MIEKKYITHLNIFHMKESVKNRKILDEIKKWIVDISYSKLFKYLKILVYLIKGENKWKR